MLAPNSSHSSSTVGSRRSGKSAASPETGDGFHPVLLVGALALSGGGAWAVGPARSVEEQPAGTVPIRPEIRLVTAATLEELAERIQADPVLLRQGADQEAETAAGEGVAAEWRTPVLTGTPGGLCTNGQGAVLREDGSVLPGLYAVGTAAAGVDDDGSPRYSRAERVCRFPARAVQTALGKPSLPEQGTE